MNLKSYRALLLGTAALLGVLGLLTYLLMASAVQEIRPTAAGLEGDRTATVHAERTITASPVVDILANALATAQARDTTATYIYYPTATTRAMWTATARFEHNLTATVHAQETMAAYPTATMWALETATAQANAQQVWEGVVQHDISGFPLPWPMHPLTEEQIEEAMACDIPELHNTRYPDELSMDDLPMAFLPVTPCDWAVLAAAYGYRASNTEQTVPQVGQRVYLHAVSTNPALALKSWLVYGDYGSGSLVEPPFVTRQPVKAVLLQYTFGGIGYQSDVTAIITDADTIPNVAGRLYEYSDFRDDGGEPELSRDLSGTIDPVLLQSLGAALTDLVPIGTQFSAIGCYDYYPEWNVLLVYADGTTLNLATNGTNFLGGGGPWQVKIDGLDYMQVSGAFPNALNPIADALQIPAGATAAMACGGGNDFIDYAYPKR